MTETDNRGEISWILDGKRLEKFPNSERSEVISPSMKILSGNDGYWIVTAIKRLIQIHYSSQYISMEMFNLLNVTVLVDRNGYYYRISSHISKRRKS